MEKLWGERLRELKSRCFKMLEAWRPPPEWVFGGLSHDPPVRKLRIGPLFKTKLGMFVIAFEYVMGAPRSKMGIVPH